MSGRRAGNVGNIVSDALRLCAAHTAAGLAAFCMQLNAQGATDLNTGATNPACGPYNEQDTFQLPNGA